MRSAVHATSIADLIYLNIHQNLMASMLEWTGPEKPSSSVIASITGSSPVFIIVGGVGTTSQPGTIVKYAVIVISVDFTWQSYHFQAPFVFNMSSVI